MLSYLRSFVVVFLAFALNELDAQASTSTPQLFRVTWLIDSTNPPSPVVLEVQRSLAPLGVDRFWQLVNDDFFNGCAFFRVVPGFVVQFGISGDPKENQKWSDPIPDDPVVGSNTEGTLSYATAGPNTRTTQLFINLADNTGLDARGFAPFARVLSGMDTIRSVFNPTPGSSDGVDQEQYETKGDSWINSSYPGINFIVSTHFEALSTPTPTPSPRGSDAKIVVIIVVLMLLLVGLLLALWCRQRQSNYTQLDDVAVGNVSSVPLELRTEADNNHIELDEDATNDAE